MSNTILDYIYIDDVDFFQYIRVPKFLFSDDRLKNLSSNAKLIYGLLLDKTSLSKKNKWIDNDGRVYVRYEEENIAEELSCSVPTVRSALEKLDSSEKGVGLIERKRVGQGQSDKIYVKSVIVNREQNEYSSDDSYEGYVDLSEEIEDTLEKEKSFRSGVKKICILDEKKFATNNTNINKQIEIKSNPILSEEIGSDELQFQLDYIIDNLELDAIIADKPYMKEFLNGIKGIISETYMTSRKNIIISGEKFTIDTVRERLNMLDKSCMLYIYDCISNNSVKVKKQKQYLLKTILNAPLTISAYYANQVKVNE